VTSWAAEQVVWFCKPDGSQLMQRDILKHSLHPILKTKKNKKTKKQKNNLALNRVGSTSSGASA
jgi:hypothetical protein